jgi:hypothetical protein
MVRDALLKLDELHNMRGGSADPRCKTCRDSTGRPAPWPCVTYVQLAAALGLHLEPDTILEIHNAGRYLNGQAPLKLTGPARAALDTGRRSGGGR